MKVYLDNCCYNRPYDDQSQLRISLEADAKLYIQEQIKNHKLDLVTSYILMYENSNNPHDNKRETIKSFIEDYSSVHVTESNESSVLEISMEIMKSGIKAMDARHMACAIIAHVDYFITTDDRVLKYNDNRIKVISPLLYIEMENRNEHN